MPIVCCSLLLFVGVFFVVGCCSLFVGCVLFPFSWLFVIRSLFVVSFPLVLCPYLLFVVWCSLFVVVGCLLVVYCSLVVGGWWLVVLRCLMFGDVCLVFCAFGFVRCSFLVL